MTKEYYTYKYLTSQGFEGVFCACSDKTAITYMREDNELNPDDIVIKLTNTYTKEIVWENKDD